MVADYDRGRCRAKGQWSAWIMRTTHRRTWQRERWLIVDERTGATHYADEMVREPDTGLLVRPKYKDPAPVTPVIPAPEMVLGDADMMLPGLIGATGIQRRPSLADHIFFAGISSEEKASMVIEDHVNPFVVLEVSARHVIGGPYFNDRFP